MKRPRRYTPDQRQTAIRRTLEDGAAVASRQLGIPIGTLSCWAHKARQGKPGFALPNEDCGETTAPSEPLDGKLCIGPYRRDRRTP